MSVSIHEVLGELRASALDKRDQGDKFERLVLNFLKTDPEWVSRFSDAWLWSDWPERGGRGDSGVDIVAQHRDREGLAAIQCKFYDAAHRVSKADLDTFLSASGGQEFVTRYFFDTADNWNSTAQETASHQAVPVQRVDIAYLDEARIDWTQYSWKTPDILVATGAKQLRPHQTTALEEVREGLAAHDRGKLVMACGTGKTFTSLKIAEDLVGAGGSVLFLVPSIQLLSQSLREWMQESEVDIRPFAVCSDVRVGRKSADEGEISTIDLTEPATTNAETLVARMSVGKRATPRMTVVFSTYQSIDVISEAQRRGLGDFDLIICDEAHRTTGVTLAETDESHFVKVHDQDYLKADKRLYMTATPRVFGEEVKRKAAESDAVLADMNDESTYGPELHRLSFGEAVEGDLLTDYKVVVLAIDEKYVAENFQTAMTASGEIALGDAAKLLGCWSGLGKRFADADERDADTAPMRRAVAFAKDIKSSKQATASFPVLVERATTGDGKNPPAAQQSPAVQARHVDGTMGVQERNRHLAWLKDDPGDDVCRVLTNARCLSEGVDVPALDAVMFLTPRGSQVDIVQAVGRVMRKAPGKKLGYIILPVVVPSGAAPSEALNDNKRYQVVWQVLQALRSHDERFHATINQIELNKAAPASIAVDNGTPLPETEHAVDDRSDAERETEQKKESEQLMLGFDLGEFRDAMYARIVKKVGERKYWEKWAADIADIASAHITRINGLIADEDSVPAVKFAEFLEGLRGNLNENISSDEAIEMLAQHLITRPIFEALFAGYDFAANNPVAQTMERMLVSLDDQNLVSEQQSLDRFYASVRRRVEGVSSAEGKQKVIVELYDNFFATAFKKTVDRLGIVYTPIEIVDFILSSADQVMREEFGRGLTDEGVHILDGFTGTGTFMVRLLQSGLISPHDLARKYAEELHANEILLLAYYIAAVNIETTYAALIAEQTPAEIDGGAEAKGGYEPFPGLVLTDTFQSYEDGDRDDLDIFPANNERIERQRQLPITVILGNPPYSVGQDSANDDAANVKYPTIDDAIRETYAARSTAKLKNSLYDSYIRAIKWACLRIGDQGVVAFVTNGGWLDSNVADGMRLTLAEEFAAIHVLNLRGNQRTAGEESRREGGKVFGGGSRATVAVTLLVKKPGHEGPATVHYTDIGDYLSREEKLGKVSAGESEGGLEPPALIAPNEHGDWLQQRSSKFVEFIPASPKEGPMSVFLLVTAGLKTNRDAWNYGATEDRVHKKVVESIGFFNSQVETIKQGADPDRDPTRISWDRAPLADARRGRTYEPRVETIREASYRPFFKQWVYPHRQWNNTVYQLERVFPQHLQNLGIETTAPASHYDFCAIASAELPDFHLLDTGQFFPRWIYEPVDPDDGTFDFNPNDAEAEEIIDGYRRIDNITDAALEKWQAAYGEDWTKDDLFFYVYALLHSPDYRERYVADLKKSLPRIPLVETTKDARAFADAGRKLSELHIGYESVTPYPLEGLEQPDTPAGDAAYSFYAVGAKKMKFGVSTSSTNGRREKDRTVIQYNDRITLSGIPEEAYRYQLGSRSAIEWIIDRYHIKTDKASGIVNDPNDWSREVEDPRYILDLLARIVTVSLETMQFVDALPALNIREDQ